MKTIVGILLIISMFFATGCAHYTAQHNRAIAQNTAVGAAIGAGVGALVGGGAGAKWGAIIGGGLGALNTPPPGGYAIVGPPALPSAADACSFAFPDPALAGECERGRQWREKVEWEQMKSDAHQYGMSIYYPRYR